jgi:hypothetical protein
MPRKRRSFSATFKSKVALDAIKGLKTVAEIAKLQQVHPSQVVLWKRQLLEGVESVFDYYDYDRPHQGLGNQRPWEVYRPRGRKRPAAAIYRGAARGPNNGAHFNYPDIPDRIRPLMNDDLLE